jgi:hypothetical protein
MDALVSVEGQENDSWYGCSNQASDNYVYIYEVEFASSWSPT